MIGSFLDILKGVFFFVFKLVMLVVLIVQGFIGVCMILSVVDSSMLLDFVQWTLYLIATLLVDYIYLSFIFLFFYFLEFFFTNVFRWFDSSLHVQLFLSLLLLTSVFYTYF